MLWVEHQQQLRYGREGNFISQKGWSVGYVSPDTSFNLFIYISEREWKWRTENSFKKLFFPYFHQRQRRSVAVRCVSIKWKWKTLSNFLPPPPLSMMGSTEDDKSSSECIAGNEKRISNCMVIVIFLLIGFLPSNDNALAVSLSEPNLWRRHTRRSIKTTTREKKGSEWGFRNNSIFDILPERIFCLTAMFNSASSSLACVVSSTLSRFTFASDFSYFDTFQIGRESTH